MKRFHNLVRVAFAAVACVAITQLHSVGHADDIDLHRLLNGPERCDHVFPLLMRHGVNNDCPVGAAAAVVHPLGPVAIPAAELGDLQIVSIAKHAEITAGCGPSFDLIVKNCSTRDVCDVRVTMVALLGRILPTSPSVTLKIASLPAGQAMQFTITMPIESLAMGNLNGQAIPFNRVLLVLDSFDQFMESNEANNLRLFDAATIPVATVAVVGETATTVAAETDESVAGVAVESNVQATTTVPTAAEPASPSDNTTELSSPDLRSAIDQFSEATTQQDAS